EQHHVLGDPDRLEAPLLDRGADGPHEVGAGVAVADRHEDADVHQTLIGSSVRKGSSRSQTSSTSSMKSTKRCTGWKTSLLTRPRVVSVHVSYMSPPPCCNHARAQN